MPYRRSDRYKLRIMELARIIGHRNYNSLQLYYNTSADELADRL